MQYLKPEVREKIIEVATSEFLAKGYLDVKMRHIAKLCGITVGNIYRYFSSKEELLSSIVSSPYQQIIDLIAKTDKEIVGITEEERFNYSIYSLLQICQSFSSIILILLTKAKGSKYEEVFEQVRFAVSKRIKYEFNQIDEDLNDIITESVLASVIHLLTKYTKDQLKLSNALNKSIMFLFNNLKERI